MTENNQVNFIFSHIYASVIFILFFFIWLTLIFNHINLGQGAEVSVKIIDSVTQKTVEDLGKVGIL